MSNDSDILIQALRDMPTPAPRPGFVDRALANAISVAEHKGVRIHSKRLRHVATSWETWFGAAIGAAAAAMLTLTLLRPVQPDPVASGITLALNEARNIDVLIESDRDLEDATIRIAVTGGVALDGLGNERIIDWRTNLERGSNLLSLPVIARGVGAGQLLAVVEHEGRTRTVMINLSVADAGVSRS